MKSKWLIIAISIILALSMVMPGCKQRLSLKVAGDIALIGERAKVVVKAATIGKLNNKDYLFLVTVEDGMAGNRMLRVFDLINPEKPYEVGTLKLGENVFAPSIQMIGKFLYIALPDVLRIIDVSNPMMPVNKAKIQSANWGLDSAVYGNRAFLLNISNIRVLDVSDPLTPKEIGTLKSSGKVILALSADRSLLLSVISNGIDIYDIAHEGNFKEVGFFENPSIPRDKVPGPQEFKDSFFDVELVGKYAYIASGVSGLRIIDISTPASPKEIANLKFAGIATRIIVSGHFVCITVVETINPVKPIHMIAVSISNPSKPLVVSELELPPYFEYNVLYHNSYVYYYGNDPNVKIIKIY